MTPGSLPPFLRVFLLFFFYAGAEVPPPRDVTMVTMNTHYELSWDWDQSAAESHAVTFTVQYVSRYQVRFRWKSPSWTTACNMTSEQLCDLTPFNLHYLGIYMLRIQASVDGQHSEWVEKEFCPDKEAALGPPYKVELAPAGSALDVVITDPQTTSNTSMKDLIPHLYYSIQYWEPVRNERLSSPRSLSTSANLVTLPDMKAWTRYCVRVQSLYDYYNKSSSFTPPQCMQTEGPISWWKIFLVFLGSLMFFFLVVFVFVYGSFRCCRFFKDMWNPPDSLPPHLKKYLCDSPGSDIPHLLTPDSESELLCEGVIICAQPAILETHIPAPEGLSVPPAGLEPDSSVRHSRQDSSSSGDSGVYSTGGSSNLQQLAIHRHAFAGSADASFDPERVKLREMASGPKHEPPVVADEGVVDVCV